MHGPETGIIPLRDEIACRDPTQTIMAQVAIAESRLPSATGGYCWLSRHQHFARCSPNRHHKIPKHQLATSPLWAGCNRKRYAAGEDHLWESKIYTLYFAIYKMNRGFEILEVFSFNTFEFFFVQRGLGILTIIRRDPQNLFLTCCARNVRPFDLARYSCPSRDLISGGPRLVTYWP